MGFFDFLFKQVLPGEFGTHGPEDDEYPFCSVEQLHAAASGGYYVTPTAYKFRDGWFADAKRADANPGRVGGTIVPETVVVHTTDMPPNDFDALIRAWRNSPGGGACAHFIIGRTPQQGLVQMVPITRNGNHAGGPTRNGKPLHGWWATPEGRLIHPNLVSVGIEVHAAGRLQWKKGDKDIAQFIEDRRVRGEFSVKAGEVYVDYLGRPWHSIPEFQLEQLEHLLSELRNSVKQSSLVPRADAAYIKDRSQWDTSYAVAASNTLVGHVTLDPINKTDPGPQLMTFISNFAKDWK